eukprot:NODE_423_length_8874_cov_0.432023.p4 type:complete len:314 gc:universal NODE_423_length_8874_cov_0.432023:773-1714(+)
MSKNWDCYDVEAEIKKIDQFSYNEYHSSKKKVSKNNQLAQLYSDKGKIFFKKGEYGNAIKQYNLAADNASDKTLLKNAYNNAGLCNYKLGNYSDAIPYFERVIEKEENTKAYFRMANCYSKLNRESEAISILAAIKGKDNEIDKLLEKLQKEITIPKTSNSNPSSQWVDVPIDIVSDSPSDTEEYRYPQPVNSNNVIQEIDTKPSQKILDFQPVVLSAAELPLAKTVASLESSLSTLSYDQKVEYLSRYKPEQYKYLFKQGIEASHIELLIKCIEPKDNANIYWNEIKSLNRFKMVYMFVGEEYKAIASNLKK